MTDKVRCMQAKCKAQVWGSQNSDPTKWGGGIAKLHTCKIKIPSQVTTSVPMVFEVSAWWRAKNTMTEFGPIL